MDVCNRLVAIRGAPKRVFTDNGSEFAGQMFDLWAYHHGVQIDFSRPGKPTDNSFVESFNGSFRDECLNVNWFESIEEAKARIEDWRRDYNESRPHQALGQQTPFECVMRMKDLDRSMGIETAGNQLCGRTGKPKRFRKPFSQDSDGPEIDPQVTSSQ